MRHYEIVVMATVEQRGQSSGVGERYKSIVTDDGGQVHRYEDWGVRRLAYPINKSNTARYFLYNIECSQQTLETLKENFRFSETVIRTLIIRRDNEITGESPILIESRKREARETREPRETRPARRSDAAADSPAPADAQPRGGDSGNADAGNADQPDTPQEENKQ